jgi:hypothetical protein
MTEEEKNSPILGAIFFMVTVLFVGAIPYLIIHHLIDDPSAFGPFANEIDLSPLRDLLMRCIYLCPVMAVLSFFVGFFPKGSKKNTIARAVKVIASIGFVLYVTNLGKIGDIFIINKGGMEITIGMVLVLALVLMIIFRLLKLPIIYADYVDAQKESEKERENEYVDPWEGRRRT